MRWLAALLFSLCTAAHAAGGYFRYPALFQDTLVFTAEGDLWQVPAAGGRAARLTTHPGMESRAAFSPDGTRIAFSGAYEGPTEVYVMPAGGGLPKRLTWYGGTALVAGWSPEGEILFSTAAFQPTREPQLAAVSPDTGRVRLLPLAQATDGAWLDRTTLVFTRYGLQGDNVRRYRGGAMASLWRFTPGSGREAEPLATGGGAAGDSRPLAWGERVLFVSDRSGVANLWSSRPDGTDLRQHTRHEDFEVREPSVSGNRVAYRHGADIRLLDLAGGTDRIVPVELASDFDQQRERWVRKPLDHFTSAALSANGERIAITARGRIATAGIGTLRRVDIAVPAGSRAREAVFMPDGRHILALCDAGGEYELWLFPADGSGPGRAITRVADALRWAAWPSPDGKWIVHHDNKRRLWLHDVASGKDALVEEADATGYLAFDKVAWAPDSGAFAAEVAAPGNTSVTQVVLYRVSDRARSPVTSTRYPSHSPAFSPDGKWLWFLSDRHYAPLVGNPWGDRNMGPHFDRRTRIYAVALQPGSRFPFQPKDELEPPKPEEPKPGAPKAAGDEATKDQAARPAAARKPTPAIVWEGLAQRLFEVPLPAANYTALATDGKRLWYLEAETTPERKTALRSAAIDANALPAETFAADVRQFALSADGKKVMWRKWVAQGQGAGDVHIADAAPKAPAELPRFQVRLADWQFPVAPRDEWRQLFADAWRFHREHLYDPAMHGTDWPAVRRKYEALLGRVTDRAELADLMAQMSAELSVLHSQVGPGDVRKGEENVLPATLGAALSTVADGARIDRIYRTDPELVGEAPPLARPEVGAKEGDVIVAVDGRAVAEVADISVLLRDKAGKQVLLALKGADGKVRRAIAVPAPAARAASFRRSDWEWERRRRVEESSGGRFGYLALRAMGREEGRVRARLLPAGRPRGAGDRRAQQRRRQHRLDRDREAAAPRLGLLADARWPPVLEHAAGVPRPHRRAGERAHLLRRRDLRRGDEAPGTRYGRGPAHGRGGRVAVGPQPAGRRRHRPQRGARPAGPRRRVAHRGQGRGARHRGGQPAARDLQRRGRPALGGDPHPARKARGRARAGTEGEALPGPRPALSQPARRSSISARRLPSESRRNAIHNSWSGMVATRCGSRSNAAPRATMVAWVAARSFTL
jgi:tricorn protease